MESLEIFDCDAILFDLDGVLVDSRQCIERILRRWAESHGFDAAAVFRAAHGRRPIDTIQLVGPHLVASAEVASLQASESTETEGVHEVPGARELLMSLPASSWAIVTSGVRAVAELRIRHTGLPTPAVLVCGDEIARGKPDPEGYLAAATRLGTKPERCVVVEDAAPGIEAARAAGMRSIGIVGGGAQSGDELHRADAIAEKLSCLRVEKSGQGWRVAVRPVRA